MCKWKLGLTRRRGAGAVPFVDGGIVFRRVGEDEGGAEEEDGVGGRGGEEEARNGSRNGLKFIAPPCPPGRSPDPAGRAVPHRGRGAVARIGGALHASASARAVSVSLFRSFQYCTVHPIPEGLWDNFSIAVYPNPS